ncbi:MAG: hypothetical protein Q9192_002500 [Flavoplaca navasiana]
MPPYQSYSSSSSSSSRFQDASNPTRTSSSQYQLRTWQQTPHAHEQVAVGQRSDRKVESGYMKETAGTKEDARKFERDCERMGKGK